MKRGPKPKLDRPRLWKTSIPTSLWRRVEPHLPRDYLRDKVAHGAISALTEELLFQWVEQQEEKQAKQVDLLKSKEGSQQT